MTGVWSLLSSPLYVSSKLAAIWKSLAPENFHEIVPLADRKGIWRRLLATLIRPMVTAEWWQKELDVLEEIAKEVRCYSMYFDKTGAIVDEMVGLARG